MDMPSRSELITERETRGQLSDAGRAWPRPRRCCAPGIFLRRRGGRASFISASENDSRAPKGTCVLRSSPVTCSVFDRSLRSGN